MGENAYCLRKPETELIHYRTTLCEVAPARQTLLWSNTGIHLAEQLRQQNVVRTFLNLVMTERWFSLNPEAAPRPLFHFDFAVGLSNTAELYG